MAWPRRRASGSASSAQPPASLAHVVAQLWPAGLGGELDPAALDRLARDYARRGSDLRDLLRDLEDLMDVAGLAPSTSQVSLLVERSATAWGDTFLGAQGGLAHAAPAGAGAPATRVAPGTVRALVRPDSPAPLPGAVRARLREQIVDACARLLPGARVIVDDPRALAVIELEDGEGVAAALQRLAAACAEHLETPCRVEVLPAGRGARDGLDEAAG